MDPPGFVIGGPLVHDGMGGYSHRDVLVLGGRIAAVAAEHSLAGLPIPYLDMGHAILTPGLIDLHIHGAFGYSFTTAQPSEIEQLRSALAQTGITTVQASLVSAELNILRQQIATIASASDARPGQARLHGIHLEGPHLAVPQCGAHDVTALREPSPLDRQLVTERRAGITMITAAPEIAGVLELIREFTAGAGVAAIGHSEAGPDELAAAAEAGARHITHLWSGMSTMERHGPWRIPGLVEASLASSGWTAEIIADGRHLPPVLLEIARKCLAGQLTIVSDATAGAGMPEGYRFALGAVECVVADGVGRVLGQDIFGGSTTLIPQMMRYLLVELGWPPQEVVPMATSTPARILGRNDIGRVTPGARADLTLWDEDWNVLDVWIDGITTMPNRAETVRSQCGRHST